MSVMTIVLCRLCSSVCDWKLTGWRVKQCLYLHKQNYSCAKCTLNTHIHRCITHGTLWDGWVVICYNSAVIYKFSNFRKRFISPKGESINLPLALAVCCHKIDALSSPPPPPDTTERSYRPPSSLDDHYFPNTTSST